MFLLSEMDDPIGSQQSASAAKVNKHSYDDSGGRVSPSHTEQDPLFDDHGHDLLKLMQRKNHLAGFVLLIGLGLHSFLAGLGFGATEAIDQAISLCIAILAHKYLAAFTLGCPFYKSGVPFKTHLMIGLCFSIITPIGIGIGWALSNGLESWVSDIFISVTAGTFIYVAIIEILVPEFSDTKKKEKLLVKTKRKVEELNLGDGVDQKMLHGIKQNVKNNVIEKEEQRFVRLELMKGLSVFSGFVIMSILALWV